MLLFVVRVLPTIAYGVGAAVGLGVAVGAVVAVATAVLVAVGTAVLVAVGTTVLVAVAVGTGVLVNVGVGTGVFVAVAVGTGVLVGVAVGTGVFVGVDVGTGVFVAVLVAVDVNVEVAVGYFKADFADPAEPGFAGLTYALTANWTPTPRLRISAAGSRTVERSPVRDADAVIETQFRLSATQALGSRFLVGLEAGFVANDYRGIDRYEQRWFAEMSLRYQINTRLSAFAAAGYRDQSGSGAGARSYEGAAVRAGLRWAL